MTCGPNRNACCSATCQCDDEAGRATYSREDLFRCTFSGSAGEDEQLAAPDLRIPVRPKDDFVGVLGQFQTTLDRQAAQFATIDGDPNDELADLTNAVETYRNRAEDFRQALQRFATDVEDARHEVPAGAFITKATTGALPDQEHNVSGLMTQFPDLKLFTNDAGFFDGEYGWRDSTGEHTVRVELGPFTFSTIGRHQRGSVWIFAKKICMELENYCDNRPGDSCVRANTTSSAGRTWVRITRADPTNTNLGWWVWNPSGGTITKLACPSYRQDDVGLSPLRLANSGTRCQ